MRNLYTMIFYGLSPREKYLFHYTYWRFINASWHSNTKKKHCLHLLFIWWVTSTIFCKYITVVYIFLQIRCTHAYISSKIFDCSIKFYAYTIKNIEYEKLKDIYIYESQTNNGYPLLFSQTKNMRHAASVRQYNKKHFSGQRQ